MLYDNFTGKYTSKLFPGKELLIANRKIIFSW